MGDIRIAHTRLARMDSRQSSGESFNVVRDSHSRNDAEAIPVSMVTFSSCSLRKVTTVEG